MIQRQNQEAPGSQEQSISNNASDPIPLPLIDQTLGTLKHPAESASATVSNDANGINVSSFSHSPRTPQPNSLPSINQALGNLKHGAESASATVNPRGTSPGQGISHAHNPAISPKTVPQQIPPWDFSSNNQQITAISPGETFQRLRDTNPSYFETQMQNSETFFDDRSRHQSVGGSSTQTRSQQASGGWLGNGNNSPSMQVSAFNDLGFPEHLTDDTPLISMEPDSTWDDLSQADATQSDDDLVAAAANGHKKLERSVSDMYHDSLYSPNFYGGSAILDMLNEESEFPDWYRDSGQTLDGNRDE